MRTVMVVLSVFLIGCSTSSGNKQVMNSDFMKSLQIGTTTAKEVHELLGNPQNVGEVPGNKNLAVWRYVGGDREVKPLSFVPIVDLVGGGQTTRTRTVDLWFENSILYDIKVDTESKDKMFAAGTVGLAFAGLGAVAAAGTYPRAPYYYKGHYYPGKAVISTVPTVQGGSISTIKWYR